MLIFCSLVFGIFHWDATFEAETCNFRQVLFSLASYGFQIGGQAAEVRLLAMTERDVKALLSSSVKLGADVGIAARPIGAGAWAATANLSADILSFSHAKDLYGGVSLEGATVAT